MNHSIRKIAIVFCICTVFYTGIVNCKGMAEETAVLTYAPNVPPPIKRKSPAKVSIVLETKEVVGRLADGVQYTFWTFGGTVPGPFMRVREGDIVDFVLKNDKNSKMPHNIDLHAVTGPGGGAASSMTLPGQNSHFTFKAINPGLYVYHCATAPVGMHIANGMYGLIFVEPAAGLPPVDKEFYVMQSEFYTKGKNGDKGLQPFSMEKALTEIPEYVVFNGSVGSLLNENAIKAKVGEKVRLFLGNGGPNLVSSFHVIGEIFDNVYTEGGTDKNQKNVQTTLIPAGGSSVVDFKLEVPGNYVLVDHSIFRTFNKGSLGILKVEGPENKVVYSGKIEEVNRPEGSAIQTMPDDHGEAPKGAKTKEEKILAGKSIYNQTCAACHLAEGQGVSGTFPPLAKSDYLNADKKRAIQTVVKGRTGEIVVNGQKYNNVMPAQGLSDEDIANALTYIYNSWGNSGQVVNPEEVKAARK